MMEHKISVDTHYTRSIHLEKDAHSPSITYIPTSRALQTLEKIAVTLNNSDVPRSWSLIGPYGSGKSAFALFIAQILGGKHEAFSILSKVNKPLSIKFTTEKKGYLTVLLTGSPESLINRLIFSLYKAAHSYFDKSDLIVNKLESATTKHLTVSELIELITELQNAVLAKSGSGILIIIDELGKFLEYNASQHNTNDIFLLQALAEFAKKGHEANLILIVLMHQTIEQYAKGLGETARNEWLKVSGRFENIPFLESVEQTMRVIAAALKNSCNEKEKLILQKKTFSIANSLVKEGTLPNHLNVQTASELFTQCYPLHPLSLLILPVLCQKIAQNERTLFSYLGSEESNGFKDCLSRLKNINEWILPHEIFDYFIQNQPTSTTDHLTHRRWAEVVTALDRLGDNAPLNEIMMAKTIGLLNIIGHYNGLKASENLLNLIIEQNVDTLDVLIQKSIITYRAFNSEYRVWEGSDFNLESAIHEAIQHEGYFNLAEKLNSRKTQLPIVARKYSIQNGTLRFFHPIYIDRQIKYNIATTPQIHFFLSENTDDTAIFFKLITNKDPLIIYVLCHNAASYRSSITEVCALERIQIENPLLKSDRVAQYEWREAYAKAKRNEENLFSEILGSPQLYRWFWQANEIHLKDNRALQHHLSTVLESIYFNAPIIKNELINRSKPSSQGNSARNKLISAMLLHSDKEDLGFEKDKFPPEKSIYRALFKQTGVHVQQNDTWRFSAPTENAYKLANVWHGIDTFIENDTGYCSLPQLYSYLNAPPFGIQYGVLPLLFTAYYLTNQRTCALYEDGIFCPQVTQENLEVLLKRPELFSVEKINMQGIQGELFNLYLEKLVGKISNDNHLLDVIKPLAKFIQKLPEYTLHTKDLDVDVLAVRDAFSQTQSPVKLLFKTLPQACGFEELKNNAETFLNKLVNNLQILHQTYPRLLEHFQQSLCEILGFESTLDLSKLRENCRKYAGLDKYTPDSQGLQAFIKRLQENKESDAAWLESIAAFLGKVPPSKWRKNNEIEAFTRLNEFGEKLEDLLTLKLHQTDINSTNVTVIRLINAIDGEKNLIIPAVIDDETQKKANLFFNELGDTFHNSDYKVKLALVMKLLDQK